MSAEIRSLVIGAEFREGEKGIFVPGHLKEIYCGGIVVKLFLIEARPNDHRPIQTT